MTDIIAATGRLESSLSEVHSSAVIFVTVGASKLKPIPRSRVTIYSSVLPGLNSPFG
jgi:hypothetical protein